MNIQEATDKELRDELKRRQNARREGLCDYCGKHYTLPSRLCARERHLAAGDEWYNGWHFEYGSSYQTAQHHTGLMDLLIPKYNNCVQVFKSTGEMILECNIPGFEKLNDREQFETAIDWANEELSK